MPSAFDKPYNPKEHEDKIYKLWEESGAFSPEGAAELRGTKTRKNAETFTVMMAPPNVTGHIHIGHALENTVSDLLVRKRRMQGYKTLFLPGKDHAGIAAQYVVERELRKENKTRFDLGKEKFLEKMWQWMKENCDAIDKELKALGLSCDWSRKRFTMDEDYQKAIQAAFKRYYEKGWIYQGKRMVNWCSRCRTSISDLEVNYEEEKGKLWFIKYPLVAPTPALSSGKQGRSGDFVTVATTRPETMLGDAAVAVNSKDTRYKTLIGKKVELPIVGRVIQIIADPAVDAKFGTGAVKITPAHDALDWEIAERHKLPAYEIVNAQGRMTKEAGPVCLGLKVTECRERVVLKLKELGLLEKEDEYIHNVGHCERCGTIIEPLLSEQWFLSMKELAKKTADAVKKNEIKFVPPQRKKIFLEWLGGVHDWNISRQLWWGHKIPLEGADDVLDTWFSSALWPFATLGWPNKTNDFKTFYPTDVISSAREIFFLWIVRMVFSGLEFTGQVPFKNIYTHATVLDTKGRKMSKSLGNVVDPLEMIEKYGTDALRFGLIWQVTGVQDIHWSESALVAGKKFCNKIWNASRFVITQIENAKSEARNSKQIQNPKPFSVADKKILAQLKSTQKNVSKLIDKYEFGQALHVLYDFFWHDFCDVYIEESKKNLNVEVLAYVLRESLKLLHPFMPFITEVIWSRLTERKNLLIIESWPD